MEPQLSLGEARALAANCHWLARLYAWLIGVSIVAVDAPWLTKKWNRHTYHLLRKGSYDNYFIVHRDQWGVRKEAELQKYPDSPIGNNPVIRFENWKIIQF